MQYHIRLDEKEIKDQDSLKKILREASYITVALCKNNEPYLVSLSHSYDEDRNCLYFHCASEGKKLDFMQANPRVWGEAVIDKGYAQGRCTHLYASVMFSGRIEFVTDPVEKKDAFANMIRLLDKNPEPLMKRLVNTTTGPITKTIVGRIVIEEMTGKKSSEVTI